MDAPKVHTKSTQTGQGIPLKSCAGLDLEVAPAVLIRRFTAYEAVGIRADVHLDLVSKSSHMIHRVAPEIAP